MKACVLCDVGRIEVREVAQPRVGARDVLLRISAVGICGTDAHIFSGHANYNTDAAGKTVPLSVQPQILGHEISGQVAEVGREVRDLAVGNRVVIDQGLNPTDRVVIEGLQDVKTGQTVDPKPAKMPPLNAGPPSSPGRAS